MSWKKKQSESRDLWTLGVKGGTIRRIFPVRLLPKGAQTGKEGALAEQCRFSIKRRGISREKKSSKIESTR